MTNPIMLFLQEHFTRLATQSPLFFRIWQAALSLAILITGLPEFLDVIGVDVPEKWKAVVNLTVTKVSAGALFMSLLSNKPEVVGATKEGLAVEQSNASLPFTNSVEHKELI